MRGPLQHNLRLGFCESVLLLFWGRVGLHAPLLQGIGWAVGRATRLSRLHSQRTLNLRVRAMRGPLQHNLRLGFCESVLLLFWGRVGLHAPLL